MPRPEASILIPVLNQTDRWLEQCIASALAQSVPCEVIVITAERTRASNRDLIDRLVRRHGTLRTIEQARAGFAASLNAGIDDATCDRVGFLLSDDWLEPTAISECLRHDADVVCTGLTVWLDDGERCTRALCQRLTEDRFAQLPDVERKANYLSHFFLFRKAAVREVGGLDETLGDSPGIDDYDLIWTLLEAGSTVAIVDQSLYNYRDHHGERLTLGKREEMSLTYLRILDKHQVPEPRRHQLLRQAQVWFGRPVTQVARLLGLDELTRT